MQTTERSLRAGSGVAEDILKTLRGLIGPRKYEVWFKRGTNMTIADGIVTVVVPNSFVANWIESHYCSHIESAAKRHVKTDCSVVVAVDPDLNGQVAKKQLDDQALMVSKPTPVASRSRSGASALRYRLEDFVVGSSNRLAYSAAVAMGSGGKAPFNPLFIHGPCGVGKTHLLQGICGSMARNTSLAANRCRYITAEAFTNEYISSLKHKKLDSFRARYRNLDLLVIDDVHFLASKRATQDEFLHTFNAIQDHGSPIVMASDTHPRLVGNLNEQLVSRFMAGMVVKVDAPDLATRLEILKRRANQSKIRWSPDVLQHIAEHVHGSVRELEGAITKLTALSALAGQTLDIDLARQALADHFARADSAVTLDDIEAASGLEGITL